MVVAVPADQNWKWKAGKRIGMKTCCHLMSNESDRHMQCELMHDENHDIHQQTVE